MTPEEYNEHLDAIEVELARVWPYPLDGSEAYELDGWLAGGATWGLIHRAVAITVARYEDVIESLPEAQNLLFGTISDLVERAAARDE